MRITILHDFFRSELLGLQGQNRVAALWETTLGPVLSDLGHIPSRLADFAGDRPATLRAMMREHGWPADRSVWLSLFSDPAYLRYVVTALGALRGTELVLGWDLSPNILRALRALHIQVIDFGLDSVTFCPDLFLRMRTGEAHLAERLAALEVEPAGLRAIAASLPAAADRDAKPFVLFVGQESADPRLVATHRFVRATSIAERIAESLGQDSLVILPGPAGQVISEDMTALHDQFRNSSFAADDLHTLFKTPGLRKVLTVSSPAVEEAALFGHIGFRLIRPDLLMPDMPRLSRYFRIGGEVLTPAFWKALLSEQTGEGRVCLAPLAPGACGSALRSLFGEAPVPAAQPRTGRRDIKPEEMVLFGRGERGPELLGLGWSQPEDWGTWSDGVLATLRFRPMGATGAMMLRFDLIARVMSEASPLLVSVTSPILGLDANFTIAALQPPPLICQVTCPDGDPDVEITLRFKNIAPPPEGDRRLLGVGLQGVTLLRA